MSEIITEGVGKKIVEALKMQSGIEIQHVVDNNINSAEEAVNIEFLNNNDYSDIHENSFKSEAQSAFEQPQFVQSNMNFQPAHNNLDKSNFISNNEMYNSINDTESFEIPNNVAILKQLISQLPSGVSKHTGAQIIRQTMEALGISMKGVLSEAQQVQESLNSSSRECQSKIMDYKRQIGSLETQSQKYQKQYSALNDIISLFIQTNN
ncbi:MAG: hypothetical protein R3Y28_00570 [Candidatus Gastranaerophilales bacterium]